MENLKEHLKDYLKVSNYAKKIDKSVTWVYKLIREKELDCQVIDGVKFVKAK